MTRTTRIQPEDTLANPATWTGVLDRAQSVFISYAPDLAVPGAPQAVEAFTKRAAAQGAARVVLLSGRGEEEAEAAERLVQHAPLPWTIVRCSARETARTGIWSSR
jgi:uncharacterized protein YbjT (DUF2867 family)